MKKEHMEIIKDLHNDIFRDELLSYDFKYIVWDVLQPREREIMFQKIDGKTNLQIARSLKIKMSSIARDIRSMKSKFRNHLDIRVDNRMALFDYLHKEKGVNKYRRSE